jgi:aerobic carbon-monoxide dehydrogenase small subunit
LETSFERAGSVQCGFCTPGMIMAAEAILLHNPEPTSQDIREGMSGNLCRCTGYNMIVEAIMIAAREGKGLW